MEGDAQKKEAQTPQQVAKHHAVDTPRGDAFDILGDRFDILVKKPIPEFGNELCKAYAARDRNEEYTDLYALIGVNTLPFRDRSTEIMQLGTIPHLLRCHGTGAVTLSNSKLTHRAFIFQRPKGKRLSEIIAHSGALPESFIIKQVIHPIVTMLSELENQGVNHGSINANTVYFDQNLTVEECNALPSGYLQLTTYESLERNLSQDAGKGAGSTDGDYFALGVLTLHLLLGYLPHAETKKSDLIEAVIQKGSYNTYMPEVEFSGPMQEFLRGTLNENSAERWDSSQIEGWIKGKRYTVVSVSQPKDSVRPFDYRDNQYYTRQHIAYTLFKDWKMAKIHLSGFKLMRWLESNIKRTDVCTQVDRIIPIGDDDQTARVMKDDELARLLSALDPQAPIRYRLISTHTDGLGVSLADSFHKGNKGRTQQLMGTIESNLPVYADGLVTDRVNPVASTVLWRLQSMRPILKTKTLGFGLERILYQLNPSLSCQQKLLLPHYTYTLEDTLTVLNNLAAKHGKTTSLADRHIAAFITNRLETNREVRIVELGKYPELSGDDRLVMLKILTMAQQKLRNPALPGLTQWGVEMVLPILDTIHQTSRREKLKQKIQSLASKGVLEHISFLIFNKELFNYDRREYSRAQSLYRFHAEMHQYLQDNSKLRLKSKIFGQQTAWMLGMLALALVVFKSSSIYF